jgi:hypothetical protein
MSNTRGGCYKGGRGLATDGQTHTRKKDALVTEEECMTEKERKKEANCSFSLISGSGG